MLEMFTMRPERSVGRYGIAAETRSAGPLALRLKAPSYASAVRPSRASGLQTPALLMMMSIWNFPSGVWSADFAISMSLRGPSIVERSACAMIAVTR